MLSSLTSSLSSALFFDSLSPDTLETLNDISTVSPEPSKRCSLAVEISQKNASATMSVLNDDNIPRKRNWLPVIKCLSFVPHEGDGQELWRIWLLQGKSLRLNES